MLDAGSSLNHAFLIDRLPLDHMQLTIMTLAPEKRSFWSRSVSYVYGDLPAETAAETILEGAALYSKTTDGLIPWKQRPDALKKGVVSRIPALNPAHSSENGPSI